MNINIISDPRISQSEIDSIVTEEQNFYLQNHKTLAEIELFLEHDEIVIKSYEASPIRRVRRITGYLSEENNFNAAKKAELHNRVTHTCA